MAERNAKPIIANPKTKQLEIKRKNGSAGKHRQWWFKIIVDNPQVNKNEKKAKPSNGIHPKCKIAYCNIHIICLLPHWWLLTSKVIDRMREKIRNRYVTLEQTLKISYTLWHNKLHAAHSTKISTNLTMMTNYDWGVRGVPYITLRFFHISILSKSNLVSVVSLVTI